MTLNMTSELRGLLEGLADDEHMIGSRHASWIGMGPFLEEDLAFCSIAQDELGHALALFELLIPIDSIDAHALLRDPGDYRSCELAEVECATWDLALVRHWLYDTAETMKWQILARAEETEVANLAVQIQRDEAFHVDHARMYLSRVALDPDARERVQAALADLLPVAASVWTDWSDGFDAWRDLLAQDLGSFGYDLSLLGLFTSPDDHPRTQRSAGFTTFHTSLGEVISLDPTAIW